MDRFTEDFPTYANLDRDEDGRPELPEAHAFQCFSCDEVCRLEDLGAEEEPECSCIRTGDWEDASYCGAHGPRPQTTHLYCKACAAPELEELAPVMADQDTAETLALLSRAGCTAAETAVWMRIIEERIA